MQTTSTPVLSDETKRLARRFIDSCYNKEGHTLTKEQMRELEQAGLVIDQGNGYHAETPLLRQIANDLY